MLHACLVVDGVSLSSVFGQIGVNELDNIQTDGGRKHSGEGNLVGGGVSIVGVQHRYESSGGHFLLLWINDLFFRKNFL